MSDRRQETRRRFTAFTLVYDRYPRTLLGYLGDLNMRGALIIGKNYKNVSNRPEWVSGWILPAIRSLISDTV